MSEFDLPDVNVLVALLSPAHVHHHAAHSWFGATERFATTPVTEAGLIRMAMNRTVMGTALSADAALASLRSLRQDRRAVFLADDSTLAEAAIDLVGLAGFRQVTDLHLTNLAARHAGRLVTFDTKIKPVLTTEDQPLVHVLN